MQFFGVLSLFVSTFLYNHLFSWIISLMPFRRKRLINCITYSVFNLAEAGFYTYMLIAEVVYYYQNDKSMIVYAVVSILPSIFAILLAYGFSMYLELRDVKIFKSRRLREFERNYNGKESKGIKSIGFGIFSLIFGLIFLSLGVFYCFNVKETSDIIKIIFMFIFGIGLVLLFIYMVIPRKIKEVKIKSEDILIDISYLDNNFRFKGHVGSLAELNSRLGLFGMTFTLSDYGYIIKDNQKIHVFGVKTEQLDLSLIDTIDFEYIKGYEYDEAVSCFVKFKRKNVYVDSEYHFIKEVDIK